MGSADERDKKVSGISLQEFLGKLHGVQHTGGESYQARCPAHDDRNSSLSVKQGERGIVVKCFAGCDATAVCGAVGVEIRELFSAAAQRPRHTFGCRLADYAQAKRLDVAMLREHGLADRTRKSQAGNDYPAIEIPYRVADGSVSAIRWRLNLTKGEEGKDLRFAWEKGARPCLYGLWRLPASGPVVLVEGESDCHTLWQAGIAALGLPGAANWREERDARHVAGREVFLCLEPDKGGEKLWRTFRGEPEKGRAASSVAPMVRVFSLGSDKDPSGLWLRDPHAGRFQAAMQAALAAAVPLAEFRPPAEWTADRRAETSPENGKAAAEHGDKGGRPPIDYQLLARGYLASNWRDEDGILRLRIYRDVWYAHDGLCYRPIPDGAIDAGVMAYLQGVGAQALGGSATRNCAANVVANLRSTALCYLPPKLEAPCWISSGDSARGWLPMGSSAIHLPAAADFLLSISPELPVGPDWEEFSRPNSPDLFATYGVPYELDPAATSPLWQEYLDRVQPNQDAQRVIAQMMGLSMVPETKYNVAFFLFGQPGTGKSVFLHVLRALVGHDNCCAVPLARMGEKHSTWPLTESLLNIVGDLETDDGHGSLRALEGTFKDVCDGSYIPVERKHKDVSSARVTARCVFATNSLPTFADRTEAMWDRLRILPFNIRIRGTGEEDPDLREKLSATASLQGIFLRALLGLGELRKMRRFPEHPEGIAAKLKHKYRCDLEGAYLEDNYERTENGGGMVDSSAAYKKFFEWLRDNGFGIRSKNTFVDAVSRVFGIDEQRIRLEDGSQPRVFRGLRQRLLEPPKTDY